jgi:hypothetical protein
MAALESIVASGVVRREAAAPPNAADLPLPKQPNGEVLAYEALRALYVGDRAAAESAAEQALRLAPDLGRAHMYAGICACARGDERRGREAWDALARLYPQLLRAQVDKATVVAAQDAGQ